MSTPLYSSVELRDIDGHADDLDDMEDYDLMEDDDATLQRPGGGGDDHIERTRT